MADEDRQRLREDIAQEKFDKSFEELDSDEVSSWCACAPSSLASLHTFSLADNIICTHPSA
jgi:hypothetical protein